MKAFLSVLAVLNAVVSFMVFVNAKSAIHEILAAVTFLATAVFLGAVGVMGAVESLRKAHADATEALRAHLTSR